MVSISSSCPTRNHEVKYLLTFDCVWFSQNDESGWYMEYRINLRVSEEQFFYFDLFSERTSLKLYKRSLTITEEQKAKGEH